MKYEKTVKARFIERENRFIATVLLDGGEIVRVHVKNTGRCRELLVPGCTVYLEDFEGRMGKRKMQYSLVAVKKLCEGGFLFINMDSQAPNKVVREALEEGRLMLPGFNGYSLIKPETKHGDSRFDFYVEGSADPDMLKAGEPDTSESLDVRLPMQQAFIEVKGVTLEENGFARFPDAPTERGLKHINGLMDAVREGYRAYIIFVIQMKTIHTFGPNYDTQPEFGEALIRAKRAGVEIIAIDCHVQPDALRLDSAVEIRLER